MQNPKPILLVEDDRIDAMAVQRIVKELKIPNQLVHKIDGQEALEYLRNDNTGRPSVILLDLNMPRMNGIELLKIIKADDTLKNIPVVFILTVKEDVERLENLNLGIAGYISKPVSCNKFSETIKAAGLDITSSEFSNEKYILGDTLVCKKE
jgi:CheY-like chemotaxis protein